MLQESAFPFCDVRQPSAWLSDQILFNCLHTEQKMKNGDHFKLFLMSNSSLCGYLYCVGLKELCPCLHLFCLPNTKGYIQGFGVISFSQKRHMNSSRPRVWKIIAEIRVTAVCQRCVFTEASHTWEMRFLSVWKRTSVHLNGKPETFITMVPKAWKEISKASDSLFLTSLPL